MTITSIPLRRLLTIAGVCTVMIMAGLSIRVAAAWTASAAPLTVAPTSISTVRAAEWTLSRLGLSSSKRNSMPSRSTPHPWPPRLTPRRRAWPRTARAHPRSRRG